jgi:hypothetical protein
MRDGQDWVRTRPPNRAKIYGIEFLELLQSVGRHVPPSLQVVLAAPVESIEFELKGSQGLCEDVEDLSCGVGDVDADAIAGDAGYAVDSWAGIMDV